MECIFCQIAAGTVASNMLYHDRRVVAFHDISPQAPVHLLIIPRKHIASLTDLSGGETSLIGHMAKVANQMAKEQGIAESGYRIVVNCGKQGGQLVPHLHMHLLGGRQLSGTLG